MKRVRSNAKEVNLDFYTRLPIQSLNSLHFLDYSKQRMKMLRSLESKHNLKPLNPFEDHNDDIISHFCMRAIASQTLHSLKWFLGLESIYYNKLLESYNENDIRKFFYNTFIKKLSNLVTKDGILYITQDSCFLNLSNTINTGDYTIKIHFTKVLSCLKTYLPPEGYFELDIVTMKACISCVYCNFLESKLYELYNTMKYNTDERLLSIHNEIFLIQEYKDKNAYKDIEALFPPCITGLVDKMKDERHLKYKDRLTLTRFLKDMNIPLEETVSLFKNHFNVNEQAFAKEYLYSIRHSYGLEGKRANYNSYNCRHIINNGSDIAFGCPFKFNEAYVVEYANKKNIDIEDLNFRNECQKNCTKVLGKMCGLEIDEVINSPVTFVKTMKNTLNNEKKD